MSTKLPTGTITAVPQEKEIDRTSSKLDTAWMKSKAFVDRSSHGTGGEFGRTGAEKLARINSDATPLLVMLSDEPAPALLKWLQEQGTAGARVYLLASPAWGNDDRAKELAGSKSARILVRRTTDLPCSAIHGLGDRATLWPGATQANGGSWFLNLDAEQSEALRLIFIRLFWYHAQDEAWANGTGKWSFHPPKERPYDVPQLLEDSPIRIVEPYAFDLRKLPGAFQLVPNHDLPTSAVENLGVSPNGNLHPQLSELAKKGTAISWAPLGLPRAAWGDGQGVLVPATNQWMLPIQLNSAQLSELSRSMPPEPEWIFQREISLSAVHDLEVWLSGEQKPRVPITEQKIPLPAVECKSLRECYSAEPTALSAPDQLALRVRYQWKNIPPSLPKGAQNDPLLGRWQKVDTDWNTGVEALGKRLDGANTLMNDLKSRFANFLGSSLLGFGSSRENLVQRLDQLKKIKPSTLPRTEALAKAEELKVLAEEIEQFTGRVSKSEQEGEEKKQRKAWEDNQVKLKADLKNLQSALATAESTLESIKQDLGKLQDTKDKDQDAKRKKLGDDQKKQEQAKLSAEANIKATERQLAEPFRFAQPSKEALPKSSGQAKFIPAQTQSTTPMIVIPEEPLPKVGSLQLHQKERFLAISRWEDLEVGEKEAIRLKAQLVAQEAH